MKQRCQRCKSQAINPHIHGRIAGVDLDLCDVCYWRKRAEVVSDTLIRHALIVASAAYCEAVARQDDGPTDEQVRLTKFLNESIPRDQIGRSVDYVKDKLE